KKRGLTGQTAKRFRLGYVADRWDGLTQHTQHDANLQRHLATNGLLITKENHHYYDRFRARIMFPIRDLRGRIIAFGGRTLINDPAKYLNSPETPIFHKSNELYGLYEARQAHAHLTQVLIVEGYMDVVSLAQHGVNYAVATLGTATSAKHIQKLLRYTDQLVFCFDGDRAGRQAAWRALTVALPLMNDGVQARFMFLPENEDPDSLIQKIGKAAFEKLMQNATPLSDFFFNELKEQIPLLSLDSKASFSKEAHRYLDTIPKGLFQQLMLDKLSELVGIKTTEVLTETPTTLTHSKPTKTTKLPAALKLCLALLLEKPSLAELVQDLSYWDYLALPAQKLFLELVAQCKQKPHLTVGELLLETNDPIKSRFIAELSAWSHQVKTEELETAFKDALGRLEELSREQRIKELITKSKSSPLSDAEKENLRLWLSTKSST
ncbi:MAG TPA: DNA primase, partial [Coxiellaceae bacterium]|nr:DNA primase [Coxiellaceae bacterium]